MSLVKYLADRAALVYDMIRIFRVSLQCHGCHLKPCGVQYIRIGCPLSRSVLTWWLPFILADGWAHVMWDTCVHDL